MHNVCELLEHQLSRAKLHVFLGKITRLFKPNNISPGAVVDDVSESKELLKESINAPVESDAAVRNFDLNANVNENEDTKAAATAAQASATAAQASSTAAKASSAGPTSETKHEEYPGWSLSDVDKMAIDPLQLAHLSTRLDEDEEDYDEEG